MRVPDHVRKTILNLWPGPKDIYVKGKKVGVQTNGVPMGDPLTKTNLSLAHPICEAYASKKVPNVIVVHDGNGDDFAAILGAETQDLINEWISQFNICAQMLGYEISEEDFFVTSSWGTYCEEVYHIPVDRFNTVRTGSKLKDNSYMPYLDHPKMRLVIDTRKDRRDYSSVKDGKYTLLGKDMEYAEQGHESGLFSVASAMQDICLGLRYEKRPVYLPRQIFSVGKMPSNWNTNSWANALWSQTPLITNLSVVALRELLGELPKNLTNMRSVKSSERHFDNEAITEVFEIPDGDPIKDFIIVRKEETHKIPPGVLDRLREAKYLTTSSEVEALYLFMKRLETFEQTVTSDLMDLAKTTVTDMKSYTFEEVKDTCQKFHKKFYKKRWAIKPLVDVDYYFQSDIDEFQNSDPRNVTIPGFDYAERFAKRLRPDTPKGRAERELFDWFVEWRESILKGEYYELPPLQLLEDDPFILQKAADCDEEVVVIVTNDVKLTRLCQNKLIDKTIMRISIENWMITDADESAYLKALKEDLKVDAIILVDEGSLDTFLYKTDINPSSYPKWNEKISLKPTRTQADIYDVYSNPRNVNSSNVYEFLQIIDSRRAVRILGRRRR